MVVCYNISRRTELGIKIWRSICKCLNPTSCWLILILVITGSRIATFPLSCMTTMISIHLHPSFMPILLENRPKSSKQTIGNLTTPSKLGPVLGAMNARSWVLLLPGIAGMATTSFEVRRSRSVTNGCDLFIMWKRSMCFDSSGFAVLTGSFRHQHGPREEDCLYYMDLS